MTPLVVPGPVIRFRHMLQGLWRKRILAVDGHVLWVVVSSRVVRGPTGAAAAPRHQAKPSAGVDEGQLVDGALSHLLMVWDTTGEEPLVFSLVRPTLERMPMR